MAARTNHQTLRQEALLRLAESRAEITAEVQRLRADLNPAAAMHRVVDRHTGGMVLGTFAAGLLTALLLVRHHARLPAPRQAAPAALYQEQALKRKARAGGGFFRSLAKAALPLLVKHFVARPMEEYFAQRQQTPAAPPLRLRA